MEWANRQKINVPAKIRCDVGKEWRKSSEFSKNKLVDYENRARRDRRVTATNSGITCRLHTAEPVQTHQCQGPCGMVFPLANFSKNTRIRGVYWCMDCTEWQLANEPGYSPYAVPFSRETEKDRLPNSEADVQDEVAASPGARLHAIAGGDAMWPVNVNDGDEDQNNEEGTESVSEATDANSMSAAMLALNMGSDSGTSEYGGSQSTITQNQGWKVYPRGFSGPNNRGLGQSNSSVSGHTISSAIVTDTASVSSRQTAQNGPFEEFNAWDGDGNFHRMKKAETVVSEARTTTTTTSTTTTTKTLNVKPNGWVKPASRKNPPVAPAYLQAAKTATGPAVEPKTFNPSHLMGFQPARSDDGFSDDDI